MYNDNVRSWGQMSGDTFVRLPDPDEGPREYPENAETYGARILRLLLAGEITGAQYLEWRSD